MRYRTSAVALAATLLTPLTLYAQTGFTTTGAVQISIGVGGAAPNSFSSEPASPPNKDLIVFSSAASNLVPGDTNDLQDVFQYTPEKGIELVSVVPSTGSAPTTGDSSNPAVSAVQPDGSYGIAFLSHATDIVPGYQSALQPPYNPKQVYIRLPKSNETLLVSKGVTSPSTPGQIGADAECDQVAIVALQNPTRYLVAFRSAANNLEAPLGVTSTYKTIFVVQVTFSDGKAIVGSPEAADNPSTNQRYQGDLNAPQFSGNGRFVTFSTAAAINGVGNGNEQVYLHERSSRALTLLSRTPSGAPGNGSSVAPSISHRAENIVFVTTATDIIPRAVNTAMLVRFDNELGQLSQVNVSASGLASNGAAYQARVSPSGKLIAFSDSGTNLVTESAMRTANPPIQTYLKDIRSGAIIRTSVTAAQTPGNADSGAPPSYTYYPTEIFPSTPPSFIPPFNYNQVSALAFGALGFNGSTIFTSFRSDATNLAISSPNFPVSNVIRTPIKPPKPRLVQNGSIEAPPDVVVIKQLGSGRGARVLITLQEFSDLVSMSAMELATIESRASSSARLQYHLEIRKVGSRQQIFRTLSKNKAVINRLAPGRYSIRYRVSKKTSRRTLKSGYSAKQQLEVS
jgi:hypothetical protein